MTLGIYDPASNKAIFLGVSIYTLKAYVRVNPTCSIVRKNKKAHLGWSDLTDNQKKTLNID